MKVLRRHLFLFIATLLASAIVSCSVFTDFDLINSGLKELLLVGNNEADEFVLAFALLVLGAVIDVVTTGRRRRQQLEMGVQRLRVLKATMTTVQDLVNNFLNNMQLFRMEAEDGPLSAESLKLFDDLIFETAEKLKSLGDSESVVEYEMTVGQGIVPTA